MKRLINWLFPKPAAPGLRNKAGGYAWIKPYGHDHGAQALAGRAVKTVALDVSGFWVLEPPQQYILKGAKTLRCTSTGTMVYPGDTVNVIALADSVLEPWKEDGEPITAEEVRDLYAPNTNKERANV